jgi:hypothetical protein
MSPVQSRRRLTLVVAAAAVATAAAASPAMASQSARVCPTAAVSHPFAPWGDVADYELAPHGDVEDVAASWSLTGGARAVDGNETFTVTRPSDHVSMRMPVASTATTGRMCIAARHTSFRFFAKRQGGTASSRLLVEVVIDPGSGHERVLTAGQVSAPEAWAPSISLPTVANTLAPAGGSVDASFRFRPQGTGVWSVDDLYVDPIRMP